MTTILFYLLGLLVVYAAYRFIRSESTDPIDPEEITQELNVIDGKAKKAGIESIKLTPSATPPLNLQSSKFGGYPYWPIGLDYPMNRKNKPLRLLAQFNLSELPEYSLLPLKGLLQFFISDQGSLGREYESKGRSLTDIIKKPAEYRVIYHEYVEEDTLVNIEQNYPIAKKTIFPFKGEYSLNFKSEVSLPGPVDHRFEQVVAALDEFHEETVDTLFEKYDSSGCKLGGYANFTQDDPRPMLKNDNWLLLFQMDTVTL